MVPRLIACAIATLTAMPLAYADSVATSPSGATFTTAVTEDSFHVTVTLPADQIASTRKVYTALYAWGRWLFSTPKGWQEWLPGTPIPAFYEDAQSQCHAGTFGYTTKPGTPLADLVRMMPGAVYYAGYGADENDLLANQKFAPVYVVPMK